MNRLEVDLVVKQIIADHLVIHTARIEDTDKLTEDLYLDEVEIAEIYLSIEEKLGIDCADAEGSENIKNVKDIVDFLAEKLKDPPKY